MELKQLLDGPDTAAFSRTKFLRCLGYSDQVRDFIHELFLNALECRHRQDWEGFDAFLQRWEDVALDLHYATMVVPRLGAPPWAAPSRPLSACQVAAVTTGGVFLQGQPPFRERGDASYREVPLDAPRASLRIWHPEYDHGPAQQDINCILPLDRLEELAAQGLIGRAAPVHYSFMGLVYSPTEVLEQSAAEVAGHMRDSGTDLALIVAVSPVCNRSAALIARAIEGQGIPTVAVMGYRRLAHSMKPPRAVYVRFPFGQPLGGPGNADQQRVVIEDALRLVFTAQSPGTVEELPYRWGREDYARLRLERGNTLAGLAPAPAAAGRGVSAGY